MANPITLPSRNCLPVAAHLTFERGFIPTSEWGLALTLIEMPSIQSDTGIWIATANVNATGNSMSASALPTARCLRPCTPLIRRPGTAPRSNVLIIQTTI